VTSESESTSAVSGFRWDFFISYTQADRAWAEWIAWELDHAGYRVLLQAWDMLPGVDWRQAMQDGIRLAERTLAVLSESYLMSVHGEAEWRAAHEADPNGEFRKLVPVRIEACRRPEPLDKIVAFDLFGLPEDTARQVLLSQVAAIRVGYAKPRASPVFPGLSPPWRFFNRRIPDEAHLVMGRLAHRRITTFAFTPANGWAMITEDGGYSTRGIPAECFSALAGMIAAGARIDCIAFPPSEDGGWLLTTDRGLSARNVPDVCQRRVQLALDDGRRVTEVAFRPDGNGWVVLDSDGFTAHGIDAKCRRAMGEMEDNGHRLTRVAFNSTGGWVLAAGGEIRSDGIDTECSEMMSDFIAEGWQITNVAFAARRNGWSLYACDRLPVTDERDR
jgi:hypothetical protein